MADDDVQLSGIHDGDALIICRKINKVWKKAKYYPSTWSTWCKTILYESYIIDIVIIFAVLKCYLWGENKMKCQCNISFFPLTHWQPLSLLSAGIPVLPTLVVFGGHLSCCEPIISACLCMFGHVLTALLSTFPTTSLVYFTGGTLSTVCLFQKCNTVSVQTCVLFRSCQSNSAGREKLE